MGRLTQRDDATGFEHPVADRPQGLCSERVERHEPQIDASLGVTPSVARKLLGIRDIAAWLKDTEGRDAIWHLLYKIADPEVSSVTPWVRLELLAASELSAELAEPAAETVSPQTDGRFGCIPELPKDVYWITKDGHELIAEATSEDAAVRIVSALNAPATLSVESCVWTDEIDYWRSSCGEDWCFVDGGPLDNRVRFCQGCGKPVEVRQFAKEKRNDG